MPVLHHHVLTLSQHAMAKELLAGFAAAEVDRLFETKGECQHECECSASESSALTIHTGLDAYDREEAKRHAKQQAEQALAQSGQY